MPYKLYVDKNEDFECEVSVKNASLKGSIARLVVESDSGPNLIFKGKIEGEKCVIPIKRLRGLLEENTYGKMHLEMVVEDTYFRPWEDNFVVEEHTSVKVRVNEQKQSSKKPMVEVKSIKPSNKKPVKIYTPEKEIATICEQFGIKKNNLKERHEDLIHILKEYFKANPEYKKRAPSILNGISNFLE